MALPSNEAQEEDFGDAGRDHSSGRNSGIPWRWWPVSMRPSPLPFNCWAGIWCCGARVMATGAVSRTPAPPPGPPSEGRVEPDGTLLCAYHAWRFDSSGRCVSIPQSIDAATEARRCAAPKACALAFPTQQRLGLLWVWGEGGSVAELECRQREPCLIQELVDDPNLAARQNWNQRDLPYGWDFFIENVADPAHVPVSHHGLVGNRYTDARYYDMERRQTDGH